MDSFAGFVSWPFARENNQIDMERKFKAEEIERKERDAGELTTTVPPTASSLNIDPPPKIGTEANRVTIEIQLGATLSPNITLANGRSA